MAKTNPNLEALTQKALDKVITTPMQQVAPIGAAATYEPEVQLNVRVPQSLVKKLKQRSLDSDKNIQTLVTESINQYLQA
jgi:predicted DNA binding CopG/RHH family protein